MKLTTIALAAAFALSGTFAFAHTVRHESSARTYPMYRDAAPPVVLHPITAIRMAIQTVRPH